MIRIIDVPIEPLEERYSEQWWKWFAEEYIRRYQKNIRIVGKILTKGITEGSFLDVCGTNYYKAEQIQNISEMIHRREIKDSDIFLFHDLWFPGLESLSYMRDALGLNFKITGCLHAGSYDQNDFLAQKGMGRWAEELENSWFSFIDLIFVATNYHKNLLLKTRKIEESKIVVTGFPMYLPIHPWMWDFKEPIILFPHRLDFEKRPDLFTELRNKLIDKVGEDWRFIRTKDVCFTKSDYYDLLRKSRIAVSFAQQETWGIAQQEAMFCGCIPIVPDRLSYSEMYFESFKYKVSVQEAANLIIDIISNLTSYIPSFLNNQSMLHKRCSNAINNMLDEIWRRWG